MKFGEKSQKESQATEDKEQESGKDADYHHLFVCLMSMMFHDIHKEVDGNKEYLGEGSLHLNGCIYFWGGAPAPPQTPHLRGGALGGRGGALPEIDAAI